MEARDRLANYAMLALAIVLWFTVVRVMTTTYPHDEPTTGLTVGGLIGLAACLTTVPVFWLAGFASHRRIAHRGDWTRAIRRGFWIGLVVALFVAMRVQGVFSLPIGLFVVMLVVLAEMALSVER